MPALDKVRKAERVPAEELRLGIEGLRRSIDIVPSTGRLIDLGTLEFILAGEHGFVGPAASALLEAADRHLRAGLVLNPMDGFAWYRLAQVRQMRNPSDIRGVVAALLQSLDMAPNQHALWVGRTFSLAVFSAALTPEERDAVVSSVHTSWVADAGFRRGLMQLLKTNQPAMHFVETSLADDAEAIEEFRQLKAR